MNVAGFEPEGELWAMMLDMRRTFDDMVRRHAGPERAEQLLSNPFYQTISTSFSGTQEYMAMEKLGQLAATGEWDLIVVDTPPSRSALDFLDAPTGLSAALDGRMIRLLTSPAKAGGWGLRKVVSAGFSMFSKPCPPSWAANCSPTPQRSCRRSTDVRRLPRTRRQDRGTAAVEGTAFLVVAAPEPDALREASYFVERLSSESMPLAGLVANRTHPVLADLSARRARRSGGIGT